MTEVFAGIGECMIELAPAGEGLYQRRFAGDTLNTAWTVRGLSSPDAVAVRYVTAVGDDAISADMRAFIATAGIEADRIRSVKGRTVGLYMISLAGAERSFTYWRDSSAAKLLAEDPATLARSLAGVTTAYFSGITLAILSPAHREILLEALSALRARGARVVFDPNIRPRLWPDEDTMRAATVAGYRAATLALPTHEDERALFGDRDLAATAARVAGYGVPDVVVKDGAAPCLVMADGMSATVPAVHVEAPVDTTGAGDSFNAGYIVARMAGVSPVEAAALGHRVAGRVITVRGALMPMADLAAIAGG